MTVDPETVSLMSTYRVGLQPPPPGSLLAGELYIQMPPDGAAPQLWVGTLTDHAASLATATLVEPPDEKPTAPPVNVDVPHLTPDVTASPGDTLSCTMGNWEGVPDLYAYQWRRQAAAGEPEDLVAEGDTYVVTEADVDTDITCTVTATNALGATTAPPSNAVMVAA